MHMTNFARGRQIFGARTRLDTKVDVSSVKWNIWGPSRYGAAPCPTHKCSFRFWLRI